MERNFLYQIKGSCNKNLKIMIMHEITLPMITAFSQYYAGDPTMYTQENLNN